MQISYRLGGKWEAWKPTILFYENNDALDKDSQPSWIWESEVVFTSKVEAKGYAREYAKNYGKKFKVNVQFIENEANK